MEKLSLLSQAVRVHSEKKWGGTTIDMWNKRNLIWKLITSIMEGWEVGKVTKNSNCSKWRVSLGFREMFPSSQGNDSQADRGFCFLVSCYAGLRSLHPPPTVVTALGHCHSHCWYCCCHCCKLTLSSLLLPPDRPSETGSSKRVPSTFLISHQCFSIGRPKVRASGKCGFGYSSTLPIYI